MLEIYLGKNTKRNQRLLTFLDSYEIAYTCKESGDINREVLQSLFSKTSDCFDLLSPSFLRFKRQNQMTLSELMNLVLRNPDQNIRLPLVIDKDKIYPDMGVEEARVFIPRRLKVTFFRDSLFCDKEQR